MDVPFLATFTTVYETGNVTRAAAELHRSQPTISYQLRRLEEAMGQALFVRHATRVVPTPLGDQLYRLACGFARDVAVLREGGPDRRAGIPDHPGVVEVMDALRRFSRPRGG